MISNGWQKQKRRWWREKDAPKSTNKRGSSAQMNGGRLPRKGTESVLSMKQGKKSDKRNRMRGAEHTRRSSLPSSNNTHMSFKLIYVSNWSTSVPRIVREQKPKTLTKMKKSLRVKPMKRLRLLKQEQSAYKKRSIRERLRSLQPNTSVSKATNLAHFNRVKSRLASGQAPKRKTKSVTLIG